MAERPAEYTVDHLTLDATIYNMPVPNTDRALPMTKENLNNLDYTNQQ